MPTLRYALVGDDPQPLRHQVWELPQIEPIVIEYQRHRLSGNPRLIGMCKEIHSHRDWLWTFLEVERVEPTNHAAERSLRHSVIWRKLSFGTQSAAGSRLSKPSDRRNHVPTTAPKRLQLFPHLFNEASYASLKRRDRAIE